MYVYIYIYVVISVSSMYIYIYIYIICRIYIHIYTHTSQPIRSTSQPLPCGPRYASGHRVPWPEDLADMACGFVRLIGMGYRNIVFMGLVKGSLRVFLDLRIGYSNIVN